MHTTQEQIEFVRAHGITRCPPSPTFRVVWGPRPKRHGVGEFAENDVIPMMRGLGIRRFGTRNLVEMRKR